MGTNYKRGKILVHGVGINDVDAPTWWIENGKRVKDLYYILWNSMLRRCYCSKNKKQFPNYIGCTVHPDWHRFSKFKEWVDNQPQKDWQNLCLDKDLIVKGNKVYGPDTCCFLTHQENTIFRPSIVPLGFTRYKKEKNQFRKFPWQSVSRVGYKTNRTSIYLGYYATKEEGDVVAGRESMRAIMEMVNANPHQFIREAMMRWVDEWKQELFLRESAFQKLGEKNNGTLQDHLC